MSSDKSAEPGAAPEKDMKAAQLPTERTPMTNPLLIEDLAKEMGDAGYCAYQPCRKFLMKAFERGAGWQAARAAGTQPHLEDCPQKDAYIGVEGCTCVVIRRDASQEAALCNAAEEVWLIKNGLMTMRDAIELSPIKEHFIAEKIKQWRREALTGTDGSADRDKEGVS